MNISNVVLRLVHKLRVGLFLNLHNSNKTAKHFYLHNVDLKLPVHFCDNQKNQLENGFELSGGHCCPSFGPESSDMYFSCVPRAQKFGVCVRQNELSLSVRQTETSKNSSYIQAISGSHLRQSE